MPENVSLRDRTALLRCRAGVADSQAHLALLDEVVSRAVPVLPYAAGIRRARRHLEAALDDIDGARQLLEHPTPPSADNALSGRHVTGRGR